MARARKFAEARDASGKTVAQFFVPAAESDALSIALRILTHQLTVTQAEAANDGGLFGGRYGYGMQFENDVFLMHPYCWCEREDCLWCGGSSCQGNILRERHRVGCYQDRLQVFAREHGELLGVYDGREHYWVPYGPNTDKEKAFTKALCEEMGLSYPNSSAVHCTCGVDAEWRARYDACECDWHTGRGQFRFGRACAAPHFWHKPSGLQVRWYKYIGRDMEVEPGTAQSIHDVLAACVSSIGGPSLEDACAAYEAAEQEAADEARRVAKFWTSDEGERLMREMMDAGVVKTITFGPKR